MDAAQYLQSAQGLASACEDFLMVLKRDGVSFNPQEAEQLTIMLRRAGTQIARGVAEVEAHRT